MEVTVQMTLDVPIKNYSVKDIRGDLVAAISSRSCFEVIAYSEIERDEEEKKEVS